MFSHVICAEMHTIVCVKVFVFFYFNFQKYSCPNAHYLWTCVFLCIIKHVYQTLFKTLLSFALIFTLLFLFLFFYFLIHIFFYTDFAIVLLKGWKFYKDFSSLFHFGHIISSVGKKETVKCAPISFQKSLW